jgi:hypothetical protein
MLFTTGFWTKDYWLDGYWTANRQIIRYGEKIRFNAGWGWGSTPDSNPLEYAPYTRSLAEGETVIGVPDTPATETFTEETPSIPIYTGE